MKQLGNLVIVANSHPDCMLQIYGGQATIHTGAGNERKSFSFDAMDDNCVNEMIAYRAFIKTDNGETLYTSQVVDVRNKTKNGIEIETKNTIYKVTFSAENLPIAS